jgi:Calcineurin-like phosphoesterase
VTTTSRSRTFDERSEDDSSSDSNDDDSEANKDEDNQGRDSAQGVSKVRAVGALSKSSSGDASSSSDDSDSDSDSDSNNDSDSTTATDEGKEDEEDEEDEANKGELARRWAALGRRRRRLIRAVGAALGLLCLTGILTIVLVALNGCPESRTGLLFGDPKGGMALESDPSNASRARVHLATFAALGDQSVSTAAEDVLRSVVRQFGAEFLLHAGDMAYDGASVSEWDAQTSDVLGDDFPVYAAAGNHDESRWQGFAHAITTRLRRSPAPGEAKDSDDGDESMAADFCEGATGFASVCASHGILVVSTVPGVMCEDNFDHADFVASALSKYASSRFPWRICLFHKNQAKMQRGDKENEVGWEVYEACREHGALIVTGHDHGYARTLPITKFQDDVQFLDVKNNNNSSSATTGNNNNNTFALASGGSNGRSVVVVVGLGGASIRVPGPHANQPWFARTLSLGDTGADYGALVCRARRDRMQCDFRTRDGTSQDSFTLLPPA